MNKYFTKEYIELCKDERIQKLRFELKLVDFVIHKKGDYPIFYVKHILQGDDKGKIYVINDGVCWEDECYRDKLVWLPTGDQLDEEIVKICKGKITYRYNFAYCIHCPCEAVVWFYDTCGIYVYGRSYNPLIAKIKLLLKLLESEEK